MQSMDAVSPLFPDLPVAAEDLQPPPLPLQRPLLPSADALLPYLRRLDESRWYSNHGALARTLSARLTERFALAPSYAVTASSGTCALAGAILGKAGRARPDKPLCLMPSYTFAGTAAAVRQAGYTPHFVDIDPSVWMLTAARLKTHPRLREAGLVVVVAPYGRPVPQPQWIEFEKSCGVPVVIDGAGCFDSILTEPYRFLGPLPVALSFHATKVFGCGEGGAVLTKQANLATAIFRALNFGFLATRESRGPSINGKMSEYHAAVALAELDRWPEKRMAFIRAASHYHQSVPPALRPRLAASVSHASSYCLFMADSADAAREIMARMDEHDIETRLWYGEGLHTQDGFADCGRDDLPATRDVASRLIGLPMFHDLTAREAERIAAALAGQPAPAARLASPQPAYLHEARQTSLAPPAILSGRREIVASVGVYDEAELIRDNIRHLREIGADHIIVTDNGSTDGTLDILSELEAEGEMTVIRQSLQLGGTFDYLNAAAIHARDVLKAEWVLFGDADEFWVPRGGDIKALARAGGPVILADRFNGCITGRKPDFSATPVRDWPLLVPIAPIFMDTIDENPDLPWIWGYDGPKAMARLSVIEKVLMGGHGVSAAEGLKTTSNRSRDVVILHLPFTTYERFRRKVENIKTVFRHFGEKFTGPLAWHWRRWIEVSERGELEAEFARQIVPRSRMASLEQQGLVTTSAKLLSDAP
ncbi:MAG: DegT/DnrJ/EryC1/StrS family aminotransferase [Hyphomicrobiales bacterium]|nr:DegT/DnrJ/EryC1/StrS family aminotransferase [Hyphomicrobiales bacterium]